MLRALGITSLLRWFVFAVIGVAIYKGFNGDHMAIANTGWQVVLKGADFVTSIFNQVAATQAKVPAAK